MTLTIRPYHPSDLYALYRICLLTGANGGDASALYTDPELPGHYFAAPYAILEPDLCFVLTHDATPCGYILGTCDSAAFSERAEREWFPPLRQRYPAVLPTSTPLDRWVINLIQSGYQPHPDLLDYPAHLHIDIMPIGQSQGWGQRLMATFLNRLRELHAPAVHLGVGTDNTRAVAFYERVGFERIRTYQGWIAFGMHLD